MTKLETPKPRQPPPPSEHPLNSREYFWERIAFGYLTDDDAAAMWRYITAAAQAARTDAVKDETSSSLADFKEAVLDINARGDAHERVVLTTLVGGNTADAARRYEAVIAQAGDRHKQALWIKGALFAPLSRARRHARGLPHAQGALRARLGARRVRPHGVLSHAIGLYEHQGNKAAAARGYERLGDLALKRDDLEAAYTQFDHAREISQKSGDDAGTARAFSSLGLLRIREKDYEGAEWYCKTASNLYEKLGEQGKSAFMLGKLGWIFYLRDDPDEARSQFGRALARYANAGMDEAAKELREEMAKVEGLQASSRPGSARR